MRSINYRLIIAIAIAIAAHLYLGLHQDPNQSGRPSWPSVQQLIPAA
jgi:hypothetical protein